MRPEVRVLGGLALMTAGGAGLIAMNLWTVPTLAQGASSQVRTPATARTATHPPIAPATKTTPAHVGPVVAAASSSGGEHADASVDAAADAPVEIVDAATSWATDGTTFPAIRFEPQSRALNKGLMRNVEPIGAYLRHNFGMKVVLIGHGDGGMDAAQYLRLGRFRAAAVLRMLVDYGVSVARIAIALPEVDKGVVAGHIPPGTVEVRIEPRFEQPKKGKGPDDAP